MCATLVFPEFTFFVCACTHDVDGVCRKRHALGESLPLRQHPLVTWVSGSTPVSLTRFSFLHVVHFEVFVVLALSAWF